MIIAVEHFHPAECTTQFNCNSIYKYYYGLTIITSAV